jgi:hypothetical protein
MILELNSLNEFEKQIVVNQFLLKINNGAFKKI